METSSLDPVRFPVLDLVRPELKLRLREDSEIEVWDSLRKKWLLLTPEEWVRQHVVFWLLHQTGIPCSLISLEKGLSQNPSGRFDVLGFDREGKPLLLVECKAPSVAVTGDTLFQASRYHQQLGTRFIWLTNGLKHLVFELNAKAEIKKQLNVLPSFLVMLGSDGE